MKPVREKLKKVRPDRTATISVALDEAEAPETLHEVARIILTCQDGPLPGDAIKTVKQYECDVTVPLCGWSSRAYDYDEPRFYGGVAYCPRCGFVLPPEQQRAVV